MPHNAETYKFETLPKYPHMRPRDVAIWDTYLLKNPNDFVRVWYDVRIGDPEIPNIGIEKNIERAWYDLNRWQIDVVAEDDYAIYVIEVKPHAGAGALGQAVAYTALLKEKWRPTKPMIPAVVTDHMNEITKKTAAFMGVEIWEP